MFTQVNELLSEVRVDYGAESAVDRFIAKIKKALLAIPEQEVSRIHRELDLHMCHLAVSHFQQSCSSIPHRCLDRLPPASYVAWG